MNFATECYSFLYIFFLIPILKFIKFCCCAAPESRVPLCAAAWMLWRRARVIWRTNWGLCRTSTSRTPAGWRWSSPKPRTAPRACRKRCWVVFALVYWQTDRFDLLRTHTVSISLCSMKTLRASCQTCGIGMSRRSRRSAPLMTSWSSARLTWSCCRNRARMWVYTPTAVPPL